MLERFKKQLKRENSTTLQEQGKFVTRLYTDKNGQSFKLTFYVTLISGEAKARLVSVEPISTPSTSSNLKIEGNCSSSQFCLPTTLSKMEIETPYVFNYDTKKSPYFSL
ncbi:MAG: hypothetical protein RL536_309, partial [Candidatus Parcubacteria bacterium]